jgi:LacI family transcriptional regulator
MRSAPSTDLLDSLIIDSTVGTPLHRQIRVRLRQLIDDHFEDGDLLWPEAVLVEHLGISRGTIRQALAELTRDGLLRRQAAKGTFIRKASTARAAFSTIGVFASQYDSHFLSSLVEEIAQQARSADLRVRLYHTFQGEDAGQALREVQQSPDEESLILMTTPETTVDLNNALTARGYRTVSIEPPTPGYAGSWVATDAAAAVDLGLDYLAGLGHRRIALLVNEPAAPPTVDAKVQRFRERVAARALQGTVHFAGTEIWQSSYDAATRAMDAVWGTDPRPTAIMTVSDPGAWAALKWLGQRGVEVPGEISVLGFEDVAPSRFTRPALSSIRHPLSEIAAAAIAVLRDSAACATPARVLLAPSLVVRESAGPAPTV